MAEVIVVGGGPAGGDRHLAGRARAAAGRAGGGAGSGSGLGECLPPSANPVLDRLGLLGGVARWSAGSSPLAAAPATRERLLLAGPRQRWDGPQVSPAHTSRLTAVTGPGWLAVGEAAVSFDPLASYGIAAALGTGYYAAGAVVEHLGGRRGALSDYAELTTTRSPSTSLCAMTGIERRWPDAPF